jgi:hypothetical protein
MSAPKVATSSNFRDDDVEFSNKIKFNSSLFARLARYGSRRAKRKSNANNQINLIMSHLNKLQEE